MFTSYPKRKFLIFGKHPIAQDTNRITTGATARLGAVPLPFVGTNNQPACSRITSKQSRQSPGCSLRAGEVYTYSNTFPILQIYPVVRSNIHNCLRWHFLLIVSRVFHATLRPTCWFSGSWTMATDRKSPVLQSLPGSSKREVVRRTKMLLKISISIFLCVTL